MYLSARMILVVSSLTDEDYNDIITDSRNDVSIVSAVSVVSERVFVCTKFFSQRLIVITITVVCYNVNIETCVHASFNSAQ